MKVEGPGRINTPSGAAKVGKPGAKPGEFSKLVEGAGESDVAAGVESTAPLSSVNALLGLQEVDDATERRGRARKRATGLLDQLEEIRNCLLIGEMPPHQLSALRDRIARDKVDVDDPKLKELMEEIELRAEVELAKLEMAAKGL
jgi:hypothetical protein